MSRPRRIRATAAILLIAAVAFLLLTAPPATLHLTPDRSSADAARTTVAGAFHVHSNRSDGTGTTDEIAAAAARAGLQFVVLTDHGDGTRQPDAPSYRSGVLCLDEVELSTTGGHYIALGMKPAPYPLGGEARDVVEDVARLGGFGVAAHPGSPKAELAWTDRDLPIDGLEWLNTDSEWRDEHGLRLMHALMIYPFRPAEALALLFDRPGAVLDQWDALSVRRRVVGFAGSDAHARLGFAGRGEPYDDDAALLKLPSYEAVFRALSIRAVLEQPLAGDAGIDRAALLTSFRRGHLYTAIDGLASPGLLEFTAQRDDSRARMGDTLLAGPATLQARVNAPGAAIILRRDGREVARSSDAELSFTHSASSSAPVAYRVEVLLANAPGTPAVPWIVSNPIYIGLPDSAGPEPSPAGVPPLPANRRILFAETASDSWKVEHEPTSRAALDIKEVTGGHEMAFRFALATLRRAGPYAALMHTFGTSPAGFDRLVFRTRADRPMRVSVQLRAPHEGSDRRWRRSVYVDETMREVRVAFDEMRLVGEPTPSPPDLTRVDALLFVVDTVNTAPGSAGVVWLDDVRLER